MDKLKSDEQLLRELACTSHGCYVLGMAGLDQRGMGTNSVCTCPKRDFSPPWDLIKLQQMMMLVRRIRDTEVKRLREDISNMVNERNEEVLGLLALREKHGAHAWETIGLFVERLAKERTSAEERITRLVKQMDAVKRLMEQERYMGAIHIDELKEALAEATQGRPVAEKGNE